MSNGTKVPGSIRYNTQGNEQAETALAASDALLFPMLVAAFNDFSIEMPPATPTVEYLPSISSPEQRRLHRGFSLMGWSTSTDAGQTWEYRGKVLPPQGWSAIWSDPALAVDPVSRNIVYYSMLGISDDSWNALTGGAAETLGRPAADGVCLARSPDGGVTFPQVHCMKMEDFPTYSEGIGVVDKTAIAVDGTGRVWVATYVVEAPLEGIRLLRSASRSAWTTFDMIAPGSGHEWPGNQEPSLVSDPEGNVWMGTLYNDSVLAHRFSATTGYSDVAIALGTDCGIGPVLDGDVKIGTDQLLRNAHSYYLAAGKNELGVPAVRIVAQVRSKDSDVVHLRVAEWTTAGCIAPSSWSTLGDAGKQFQPTIHYADRDGRPVWELAYLTTSVSPDPTKNYVIPEAVSVGSTGVGEARTYLLGIRQLLAPTDWYACPQSDGYWGDYFGLTQVRDVRGTWWSVSAFSASRPAPPCTSTDFFGRPLHVAASRW